MLIDPEVQSFKLGFLERTRISSNATVCLPSLSLICPVCFKRNYASGIKHPHNPPQSFSFPFKKTECTSSTHRLNENRRREIRWMSTLRRRSRSRRSEKKRKWKRYERHVRPSKPLQRSDSRIRLSLIARERPHATLDASMRDKPRRLGAAKAVPISRAV
jgi:hypothetical protein